MQWVDVDSGKFSGAGQMLKNLHRYCAISVCNFNRGKVK